MTIDVRGAKLQRQVMSATFGYLLPNVAVTVLFESIVTVH